MIRAAAALAALRVASALIALAARWVPPGAPKLRLVREVEQYPVLVPDALRGITGAQREGQRPQPTKGADAHHLAWERWLLFGDERGAR